VRQGRRQEFATFLWQGEPPDPQAEATFQQARLDHTQRQHGHHRVLYTFYSELLQLRQTVPALAYGDKETMEVLGYESSRVLYVRRWWTHAEAVVILHFGQTPTSITLPLPEGSWHKRLDSAEAIWDGAGSVVPAVVLSTGEVVFTLPPETCILVVREPSEDV
jgi:maltooligosyltrehalose trehalohydrolase